MTDSVWGTQTDPSTGATRNLNLSLGNGSDIGRFAGQRATQAAIDAGIRAAMEGGSFQGHLGDSVESAVAHVVSGVLFHAVGDMASAEHFDWTDGSPEKIALHALVGGIVNEAMGGDFRTGALAAGANEAMIEQLADLTNRDATWLAAASQIVGIVAAELSGGDVAQGAEIAGQATRYNYLSHQQLSDAYSEIEACNGDRECMADVVDRYQALSQLQDEAAYAACLADLATCQPHALAANSGESALADGALWDLDADSRLYMQALFDENVGVQLSMAEATAIRDLEAAGVSPELAVEIAEAAMTMGVVVSSSTPAGAPLAAGATIISLVNGYLNDEMVNAFSKQALVSGFEKYAAARGLPVAEARRLASAIELTGMWDRIMENGKSLLGLGASNDEG